MYKHILSWLVVSTPLKNIVHVCSYLAFPPNHPGNFGQGEALWLLATDSENLAQQALELPEAPFLGPMA